MKIHRIYVDVPAEAGTETAHKIMDAVADAAWAAQPDDRTWDVLTYTHGVVDDYDDEPAPALRELVDLSKITHAQRIDPITREPIGPRIRLRPVDGIYRRMEEQP